MKLPGVGGGVLAALCSLLAASPLAAQQTGPTLPGWLVGCWRQASATLVVEEFWLPPAGGALIGMSRTLRQDSLVGWEQLVIRPGAGGLVLEASPSNQPRATFGSTTLGDAFATFENPAHDFPQAIHYERRGADSLYAMVSGTLRDRFRSIEFEYARIECPL